MSPWHRIALAAVAFVSAVSVSATATAQPGPDQPAPPPEDPAAAQEPKKPKRGDFDAGGQVRLPNGPDEDNQYASFNWIALDLKGRYYLLDQVTVTGTAPLAVKKPDALMTGEEPSLIGGLSVTFDATLPEMPFGPKKYKTEVGLVLTGAMMREGAMLLSDKDYPLFTGGFKPGFASGLRMKVKLSSLVDFSSTPVFVLQQGTMENATGVQIPTSLILALGSLVKVSADVGIYTGDDFGFRPSNGGRLAAGASLDLKIGPILAHVGAGTASLLPGGLYPTVRDSVYIDLNVKYVK